NFFALLKGVKKHGHSAEIERHRAQAHEVRGNAGELAANDPNRFPARWNFPAHQFFHRQGVGDVVRQWRKMIETVGVGDKLVVLHVLGDFFVAAMEETDVGGGFGDDLAVEFEDQSQDSVGGGMRWPHVDYHLFADVA